MAEAPSQTDGEVSRELETMSVKENETVNPPEIPITNTEQEAVPLNSMAEWDIVFTEDEIRDSPDFYLKLNTEVAELCKEATQLRQDKLQLESNLDTCQRKLGEAESFIESLKVNHKADMVQFEHKYEKLESDYDKIKKELEEFQARNENADVINKLLEENQTLKLKLTACDVELSTTKSLIESLEGTHKTQLNQLEQLLGKTLEKAESEMEQFLELGVQHEKLKSDYHKVNKVLEEVQSRNDKLFEENQTFKSNLTACHVERSETKSLIESLKRTHKTQLIYFEQQCTTLVANNDELKKQLNDIRGSNNPIVKELQAENEALRVQNTTLGNDAAKTRKNIERLHMFFRESEEEKEKLRKQLDLYVRKLEAQKARGRTSDATK